MTEENEFPVDITEDPEVLDSEGMTCGGDPEVYAENEESEYDASQFELPDDFEPEIEFEDEEDDDDEDDGFDDEFDYDEADESEGK